MPHFSTVLTPVKNTENGLRISLCFGWTGVRVKSPNHARKQMSYLLLKGGFCFVTLFGGIRLWLIWYKKFTHHSERPCTQGVKVNWKKCQMWYVWRNIWRKQVIHDLQKNYNTIFGIEQAYWTNTEKRKIYKRIIWFTHIKCYGNNIRFLEAIS